MMKQILAAVLIVSASAAAVAQQQPSDENRQSQPSQTQPQPGDQQRPGDQQQPSNQFNARDYTQIQSSEIPSSLRTTLQGDTYKGWEGGRIYRRTNGDGYWVSTGSGNKAKNYYFDKNGKAIQSGNQGTGRSNDQNGGSDDSSSGSGTDGSSESGSGSNGSGSGAEKPRQ